MTVHLVKLAVGCDGLDDLAAWQTERLAEQKRRGEAPRLFHRTFQTPKRRDDLLDGGSLYWVIKGIIQCRQRVIGLEEGAKDDGSPCCLVMLDPKLVAVRPVPRRAFQGWRYMDAADAPKDIGRNETSIASLPPEMAKTLADLGLL
ncbi:MAG TPA: DUF1489 domain-containing protein [Hyphomicrobiaceae bacterium]|nr:DUF1489 domain-containing protein [Hyphomicrobiaceae bacterium]